MPRNGAPKYIPLLKNGGGGPAFIVGVKGEWLLIRQGNGYQVFNYLTNRVVESDEHATPGARTVLRPQGDLLPSVPLYPVATKHGTLPGQRASLEVKGEAAAKVLAWYETAMPDRGWEAVQICRTTRGQWSGFTCALPGR